MTPPLDAQAIITALKLPARCSVDQRVPKKMLADYGAPTAADRRLLTEGIEELQWIAALKPGTVAVPEYRDHERAYLEVAVLALQVRPTHSKLSQLHRLAELVHRAVPYPVLLVQTLPSAALGEGATSAPAYLSLSLAHKRAAQNETAKVVLDGEVVRTTLTDTDGHAAATMPSLLEALALDRQPHQDLMALYQGWMDCLTASEAARITGHFRLARGAEQATARRDALRTCQRLEQEAARLRNQATKERQVARQVDLNLALQRLQADLRAARAQL